MHTLAAWNANPAAVQCVCMHYTCRPLPHMHLCAPYSTHRQLTVFIRKWVAVIAWNYRWVRRWRGPVEVLIIICIIDSSISWPMRLRLAVWADSGISAMVYGCIQSNPQPTVKCLRDGGLQSTAWASHPCDHWPCICRGQGPNDISFANVYFHPAHPPIYTHMNVHMQTTPILPNWYNIVCSV